MWRTAPKHRQKTISKQRPRWRLLSGACLLARESVATDCRAGLRQSAYVVSTSVDARSDRRARRRSEHDTAEVSATVAATVSEEETTCARWPCYLCLCWPLGARLQSVGAINLPDTTTRLELSRFISGHSLPLQIPRMRSNHIVPGFDGLRRVPLACSLRPPLSGTISTNPLVKVHTDCRLMRDRKRLATPEVARGSHPCFVSPLQLK